MGLTRRRVNTAQPAKRSGCTDSSQVLGKLRGYIAHSTKSSKYLLTTAPARLCVPSLVHRSLGSLVPRVDEVSVGLMHT